MLREADIRPALDRAKATLAKSGTRGDFVVEPRGVVLSVTWRSPYGSRRDVAREALREAAVELRAVDFDAELPIGLDWLPVRESLLGERVSDRRDGEAAVHGVDASAESEAECLAAE